jgi:hypothetical protein
VRPILIGKQRRLEQKMTESPDQGLVAVRLEFSNGYGVMLVEREEGYTLFDVERFCWLNAQSIWNLLGEFVGASEMLSWLSRAEFEAWRTIPENAEQLVGHAGRVEIDVTGPIRLSDNAGATL